MRNDKEIVWMYSGQGSQYYQMAKELFDNNIHFKNWMERLDEIVIEHIGTSIVDIIYHKENKITQPFTRLLYTNPAIFMISYSLSRIFIDKEYIPDFLLGYSLGELTTLSVSGMCDYEDMLKMLLDMSTLIENECVEGKMIIVMANKNIFYDNKSYFRNCELAFDNYDLHFVLAGDCEDIQDTIAFLNKNSISYYILPLKYPFHSSYLDPIEEKCKEVINKNITIKSREIEVISCVTGKAIDTTLNTEHFWQIIRKPIKLNETIKFFADKDRYFFIDMSVSPTMASLLKSNLGESCSTHYIINPFKKCENNVEAIEQLFISNKI